MRKISILFSAIAMSVTLTSCGNASTSTVDVPSSQAETSAVSSEAESQSEELVEIDPFEGFEVAFHHDYQGRVVECDSDYPTPDDLTNFYPSGFDGLDKLNDLGCNSYIYRDALDENIKEGDTVTYELVLEDGGNDDIQNNVKEKYNVNLTQITKDITVHFEEDPIEDCDPFEGMTINFDTMELDDGIHVWYDTNIDDCEGRSKAASHKCEIGYEAIYPDGKDEDSLAEGDLIKFVITYRPEDEDTIYMGEEAKEKIEEYQWYRLNLTRTEYEVTIDLSNSGNTDEE